MTDGMGDIDMANFLGPDVILRHIDVSPECAQPPRARNGPANLFHYLAVERLERRFTGVNATAWQLNINMWPKLGGHQKAALEGQDRIGSGARRVCFSRNGRFPNASHHMTPPFRTACCPYIDAVCQPSAGKESQMTQGNKIAWDDTVLPFQLDASDIRGRVARLDGVLEGILRQHDYPEKVEALVAEMALLTALIGQTIKLRWKLQLQVQSKGPVRMIATDYYGPTEDGEPARIRAYASYDADRITDGPAFDQVGEGYFAIMIDQGNGMTPYQGITPLTGKSLSECAEAYFAQSEQLPTRFELSFGKSTSPGEDEHWRAGGVMLQHMPKASPFAAQGEGSGEVLQATDLVDGEEGDNWRRVNVLLDTVDELELIGPSLPPTDLLKRLFHEEMPRVFDAQAVRFGCTCSEDRVRQSLSIYSAGDIETMTTDDGRVTADCQFCGAHYDLDPKTVGFEAEDNSGS